MGTEAALQPLIQLYSIYIGLVISEKNGADSDWKVTLSAFMNQNWTQLFALLQQSKYIPQIWSFISSVVGMEENPNFLKTRVPVLTRVLE